MHGVARLSGATLLLLLASCTPRPAGTLDDRFTTLQSTLIGLGLSPTGSPVRGTLADGKSVHFGIHLPATCVTIAAAGGAGMRELALTLRDSMGAVLAKGGAQSPTATFTTCLPRASAYDLEVAGVPGAGADFLFEAWLAAGAPHMGADGGASMQGTCESPIPLLAGATHGSTKESDALNSGSCRRSSGNELVYRLDVQERAFVHLAVNPSHFDSVLYIRKGTCDDPSAEVQCNDDAIGGSGSRLDALLDAGVYFVFVDSYEEGGGPFSLLLKSDIAEPIEKACREAPSLANGVTVAGTTVGASAFIEPLCRAGGRGRSQAYSFDVEQRSRVRIEERSSEVAPAFTVRRACADRTTEIACVVSEGGHGATFANTLDKGHYAIFATGRDEARSGQFALTATAVDVANPPAMDAAPILLSAEGLPANGDTMPALDHFAGACSRPGSPDVAYHLDVRKRSRLYASFTSKESSLVFSVVSPAGVSATPGAIGTEVGCGSPLDVALPAGGYTLLVDGANENAFGRYEFGFKLRDLSAQPTACKDALLLHDGAVIRASTTLAGDKFTASCGGREDQQEAANRIYKFVLSTRSKVRLLLTTLTWDGVLALRAACEDGTGPAKGLEIACNDDASDSRHSKIETTLDAGTYWVLVDGRTGRGDGPFSLEYKVLH